ncbi:MAG TPA: alpha-ketoglutarate-dependent dioxygenase AlkB [Acidimicrobiales bacterium]|jgi:alkylated DNA repair dioxygenase AlkB|nr:alpha-ketoglutarate-dependent dioxygenase AlkB [Acidimicrobiales bacterium]
MTVALAAEPEVERLDLGAGAWVDVVRGWIDDGDELHDHLAERVPWRGSQVYRYDHYVQERRVGSFWKLGSPPPHPVLLDAQRWLQHRYHVRFDGCSLIRYRDGSDGQAFHRDRELRWLDETLICVLSLGARRPWLLRPRANRHDHDLPAKGATHDFAPDSGDLLVMGGTCQVGWEHSVAYQPASAYGSRVSLQWRWTSRRGRPEVGANYRAPRFYGRGGA